MTSRYKIFLLSVHVFDQRSHTFGDDCFQNFNYTVLFGRKVNTVELQWLGHLWNHENILEIGEVRTNECYS